jgi:hypothetical protein
LEVNYKEENKDMLKEFLGVQTKNSERGFSKQMKAFFKNSNDNSKESLIKKFLCETNEQLLEEWNAYKTQVDSKQTSEDQGILGSIQSFIQSNQGNLNFENLKSVHFAVNNYCSLNPDSHQEDLVNIRGLLLEQLCQGTFFFF